MSVDHCDEKQKSRQHSDFPGGHPPEYYPSLRLLNFAKRTGYGALSLRWPSTTIHTTHIDHKLATRHTSTHKSRIHTTTLYASHARTQTCKYSLRHLHCHVNDGSNNSHSLLCITVAYHAVKRLCMVYAVTITTTDM